MYVFMSAIQTIPTAVNHFEEQKIIAVAAGDEFSLALDARWHPWGWGRAEQGQVCVNVRSIFWPMVEKNTLITYDYVYKLRI